jgi:hypothetical protein
LCQGKRQKKTTKFLRCCAAKGRPAFAIRGFSRAIPPVLCRNQAAETKEKTMKKATRTPAKNDDTGINSRLLDIKRQLEKAQNEVEMGNPQIGITHIEDALDTVYQLLGI